MMNDLKKVAVVTGGNKGIGFIISNELAKNDYHVVSCGRTNFEEKPVSDNVHFFKGDLTNYKSHKDLVDFAVKNLRIGGCLMVDNVIWGGAVLDKEKLAKPTSGGSRIHRLNQHIANHPQLENVLIPVWDGIQVARKIS